ncbi:MAG: T9SS type A sorting domain-containing protein [Bacteroidales bacterium]|nr:T9SS type A sorting domain-containing protein [Bacteroidales bacterium]
MKNVLLSFLIVAFAFAGYAQHTQFTGPNKRLQVKQTTLNPAEGLVGSALIPGQKLYDFDIIGYTWNDLQALNYGNVMQRMWAYSDGTVGSSWLCAGENDDPDRGAGYNYYDGNNWGEPDWHVGPDDRMGSPSYAPYGPEGEIISLYRYAVGAGPIYFYIRETKGEGDWEELELLPPDGVSLVWHSMITSGENFEYIHLLALTYDAAYNGQEHALLYYRSSDGGQTWDISEQVIDGLGPDYFADINSLSYAWANPVGSTIAFTYGFDEFGGRIFKSTDNGDSWTIIPVFDSPFSGIDPPETSDRFGCGVGTSAIALDSQGKAHVAFSRMVKNFQPDGVYYEPFTDGMIYWNEDMPVLDTTTISANTMEYLEEGGYLMGWVIGDETYEIPDGQPNYANALCAFPQFSLDAQDNMFVAYCSLAPGFSNGTFDYRHVILNRSFDGGNSWVGQIDLNTDLLFVFSECVFPMMAPLIDDMVHVTYQEDNEPGINQWLANHDPVENRIHHMAIPTSSLVGVNPNVEVSNFEVSQVYPNPSSGQVGINLKLDRSSEVSIVIMNVMGQQVQSLNSKAFEAGSHPFNFDVSDLDAGVYYLSVTSGEQQITRKFVIQ